MLWEVLVGAWLWRYDTEHNDTRSNYIRHKRPICNSQHTDLNCYTQYKRHTAICFAECLIFIVMLSDVTPFYYAQCHCAAYCNAMCRCAECHYAECRYAECHYAEYRYAECHYAEFHYAECCYSISLCLVSLCSVL